MPHPEMFFKHLDHCFSQPRGVFPVIMDFGDFWALNSSFLSPKKNTYIWMFQSLERGSKRIEISCQLKVASQVWRVVFVSTTSRVVWAGSEGMGVCPLWIASLPLRTHSLQSMNKYWCIVTNLTPFSILSLAFYLSILSYPCSPHRVPTSYILRLVSMAF